MAPKERDGLILLTLTFCWKCHFNSRERWTNWKATWRRNGNKTVFALQEIQDQTKTTQLPMKTQIVFYKIPYDGYWQIGHRQMFTMQLRYESSHQSRPLSVFVYVFFFFFFY